MAAKDRSRRIFLTNPFKMFPPETQSLNYKSKFISEPRIVNGKLVHYREFIAAEKSLKQPMQHAIEHAKELAITAQRNNLPVKLFLSGGIDSEAMAEAFMLAEVSFEAVIGRYNTDMNEHDYCAAISFCEKHDIKINFIDVDVFDFLESGKALKYAHELGCRSPQIAVHLHMLEQTEGFCVLGGNPILPIFKNASDPENLMKEIDNNRIEIENVYGLPGQPQSVYLRYFEKTGNLGEPFFFQSSPELCMSFLNLDEIFPSLSSDEAIFDYKMKCKMYQLGGFCARPRQGKFTGFEKYRAEYDRRMNTEYGIGFNEKFRKPLEELNLLLPHITSFVLSAQIVQKIKRAVSADRSDINLKSNRRAVLQKFVAFFGGVTLVSLFPSFANAADPCCCDFSSSSFPVTSEKECAAACAPGGWEINPVCN